MGMRSFLIRDILSGGGPAGATHHQGPLGPLTAGATGGLAGLPGAPLVSLPGVGTPIVGMDQHQAAAAAAAAQSLAAAQARFLAKWAEHQQQIQASKYLEQFRQQQGPLDHQQLLSNLNLSQQQQQQLQIHLQQQHHHQRQLAHFDQDPQLHLNTCGINETNENDHAADNNNNNDDDDDDCEIEVDERPLKDSSVSSGRGRRQQAPSGVETGEPSRFGGARDGPESDDERRAGRNKPQRQDSAEAESQDRDESDSEDNDDVGDEHDDDEEILDVNCETDAMSQHNQELAGDRRHLIGAGNSNKQHLQASQFQQLNSPLDALFQMTSSTFDVLKRGEKRKERDTNHHGSSTNFANKQTSKKKRKSRTAFTNNQIYELERRFRMQKYLSPTDRDEIAMTLNLSNAQVITWFQNRRAKMKRDLEEQKRDIETASLLNLHKTFLESFQALSQIKTAIKPADTSGICSATGTTIPEDMGARDHSQIG